MADTNTHSELSENARHRVMMWAGALALASLPIHYAMPPALSVQFASLMVALIAGVYAGFALNDGRLRIIILECGVALLFFFAAALALWFSKWIIPALFALHGLWDIAHHRHISTKLPSWYPSLCAVFDWIIALGLSAIWLYAS